MEIDGPPATPAADNNDDCSISDSDDDEAIEPVTVTAAKPAVRLLPPPSELNSPLAILSHFVYCVMDAWVGYQVALSQKCGGKDTQQKDEWLREEIVKLLVKSNNLEPNDLVEWLEDVLSEDFNLILEDDSTKVASQGLLQIFHVVRERFIVKSTRPTSDAGKSERDLVLDELKVVVEGLKF